MSSSLEQLKGRLTDVTSLRSAIAVLDWDQQTYMPSGGAHARATTVESLSRIAHEIFTADETRQLLEKSKSEVDPNSDEGALVRVVGRDVGLATKFPSEFVARKTKLAAIAHEDWVKARANNDFAGFEGTLTEMFEIAKQEAEYLGYTDHIYDALLDQYEEGATAADCVKMFEALKAGQVPLVKAIQEAKQIDDSALYGEWDSAKQSQFTEFIAKEVGYDFNRGRQDVAPHPFCTTFGIGDVRITTRYKNYIGSAVFGTLHESGHAMYEQGSPAEWEGSMLAGGVSLGIHESQSRFWENIVGRSLPFWNRYLPKLQETFPALSGIGVEDFYRQINKVETSFIRVEADELTYNLHVLVRFEIECDILTGKLAVKDLPEAWNAKYTEYLGITPNTNTEGCLQDVHWSMGSIGYFPTYSMGNVLSYQIWNALKKDIPSAEEGFGRGEFKQVHDWLIEKIYRHGRKFSPKDLVVKATGKPMDPTDYIEGLNAKYRAIYGL